MSKLWTARKDHLMTGTGLGAIRAATRTHEPLIRPFRRCDLGVTIGWKRLCWFCGVGPSRDCRAPRRLEIDAAGPSSEKGAPGE